MHTRPRILFLSHSPYLGGAERCLHALLQGLSRAEIEPLALVPPRPPLCRRDQQDLAAAITKLGIRTLRTPIRWWLGGWPRYEAFARGLRPRVARIAAMLRREAIDLVVSNSSVAVEGALAARTCGIPHIWNVLEMLRRDPALHAFLPLDQFYDLLDDLSYCNVAVSEAVKADLESSGRTGRVRIIPTGLPPRTPRPIDRPKRAMFGLADDTPTITFLGLLSERKGVMDLVESAPRVLARFPAATFLLAGSDGGRRRAVLDRAGQLGVAHFFRLLGNRNDVPEILAASDMLVLPSLADPLPLSVLEAMGAGVPVVATRSGGCEEMVEDGRTGHLVPVHDPARLAEAIAALLADPAKAREMGRCGRNRAAHHFSHENYVRGFEQLLLDAVATHKPPCGRTLLGSMDETLRQLQESAMSCARRLRDRPCGFPRRVRDQFEAAARSFSWM